jgi:hypothetical protein
MSTSEHSKPEYMRSVYDTCDPVYLRKLREEAGIDLFVLARTACLSVAQVRELESHDSDNLFYSDAIKRQAYKRLLMILGAEPPTVEVPHELQDAIKVADAHLNTLDQIVAMSHQPAINRSTFDVLSSFFTKLKQHKQFLGALLLLLVAIVLFVFHGPQRTDESSSSTSAPSEAVSESAKPAFVAEVARDVASVASVSSPVAITPASSPIASSVASAPMPVASTAAATAVSAASAAACAYSNDAMAKVTPFIAQKEGRYVYLVSSTNTEVCLVDGNKQATVLQMKAGDNRSVYGVSPWQISTPSLSKLQVFFQGGRVTVPETATRVNLIEVPVTR